MGNPGDAPYLQIEADCLVEIGVRALETVYLTCPQRSVRGYDPVEELERLDIVIDACDGLGESFVTICLFELALWPRIWALVI